MEKPSESGRKQGSGSSPAAARAKKQKTAATTTYGYSSQSTSSFGLIQPSGSETPNTPFTQSQPLSQGMDQYQIQLSGTNSSQQIEYTQMKDQLAEAKNQIRTLQKKIRKVHETRAALDKYMDGEDKTMNELIEKQKILGMHRSFVEEKASALRGDLEGFQESKNKLKEFYNNVILKQDERIKELKEQLNQQNSTEERELTEPLRLIEEKLAQARIQHQQARNQAGIMNALVDQMNGQQKELDKMIGENQHRHDEEMKTLSAIGKDIDVNLEIEREEKSKLLAKRDENSSIFEKLSLEFQALQEKSAESKNQMERLKSSAQEMGEQNTRLKSELDALRSTHRTIVSERDLEVVENRKQLQGLSSKHKETIDKLSEMNSNNEKLSDTVAKEVQRNQELKKALLKKSYEMTQLVETQNAAQERNEELSATSQRLAEELIVREKVLLQTEADLDICNATQDENSTRESELKARLATAKRELQDKIDYKAKLRKEVSNAELRSVKEAENFEWDIELKNKELAEMKKMGVTLRVEDERVGSENDRKLQQLTNLSSQCQKARHEKLIKEQDIKIDLLQHQIQAQKLDRKQENMIKTEMDRKEKEQREAQVKEMESKIENVKRAISDMKELQEDLKNIMKKAQTSVEAKATIIEESLNSSGLLGTTFAKHQSIPTSSTPVHSPTQNRTDLFGFESLMEDSISSIEGLDIFEKAKRNYAIFQQTQIENLKSSQSEKTDTS